MNFKYFRITHNISILTPPSGGALNSLYCKLHTTTDRMIVKCVNYSVYCSVRDKIELGVPRFYIERK